MTSRFQSTPPHGGRLDSWLDALIKAVTVSIHAPARGATQFSAAEHDAPSWSSFNPRPRTGGDMDLVMRTSVSACCWLFQSTPPHGGRRLGHRHCTALPKVVSIHAPARGATGG